ncbi:unnamed protein product [Adineta ricciae]|uniref:UBZ4-type domain-containing protein n=1 Tax=Adineta ricciae TaxID=249248 RepID=A0A815Q5J7_ADIRI|nr:unnamed protein product [Adineta ricciae]
MYYETEEGDQELKLLYDALQAKLAKEDNESDDDGESKAKRSRKRRRNEASILEQENEERLSNVRPKRAAALKINGTNVGQRRIDEFISKKRSPSKKTTNSTKPTTILPPLPIPENERCPICDRLISSDILQVHTDACLIQNSDSAKELIEKSKQRTKTEAKAKEILFQRATRKTLANHLTRADSETTTCPTCHMQMTVSRLENQHRKECSNRRL